MRTLWTAMGKDLRRRFRDPMAILLWIGIPALIGGLMSLVAGGGDGVSPRARILLVDQDDSFVSNFFAGAGEGGELGEFLDIEPVELEEGQRRIDSGDGTALLVLPEGFGEALLDEKPCTLRLTTNPAQTILPKIVTEGLTMMLEATFYAQRVLGEPLRAIVDGPGTGNKFFESAAVAALSVQINDRMQSLEQVLFPPVLDLESETRKSSGQVADSGLNFGNAFLPGILFMALLFIAQGMSEDLWDEKIKGTLRRTLCAPGSLAGWVGGKLLASALLMGGVTVITLFLGYLLFDFPLELLLTAGLWCAFSGATLFCLFAFLTTLASSQRVSSILSSAVVFPLMMVGGSFFPFEAMPDGLAAIGRLTPNGLAVTELRALIDADYDLARIGRSTLWVGLPALALFVLTVRRIGGSFATR